MDNANAYQAKNEIQRQANHKYAQIDKNSQKQLAFNEKLDKLLKETQKTKHFNYDIVFT